MSSLGRPTSCFSQSGTSAKGPALSIPLAVQAELRSELFQSAVTSEWPKAFSGQTGRRLSSTRGGYEWLVRSKHDNRLLPVGSTEHVGTPNWLPWPRGG